MVELQGIQPQAAVVLDKAFRAVSQPAQIIFAQSEAEQTGKIRKDDVPHGLKHCRRNQNAGVVPLGRTAVSTEKTALFHGEIEPFW